jgi:hypothetical protein
MDSNNIPSNQSEEISLKDLVLKTKAWLKYFKAHVFLIILISVLGAVIGGVYAKFIKKTIYSAQLTFTLEQKGKSMNGLGGIASSLGLGDISGGGSGMFGGDNILVLMKSNRIIHQALKEPIAGLEGGNLLNNYIINHYSKAYTDHKISLFPVNYEKAYTRAQDSLLIGITNSIKKTQLTAERTDKKTTIIAIDVKDQNELWAYQFSQMLVKHAIDLYMDIKVGKLMATEKELSKKQDSIRSILDGSISKLAYETDLNSHAPLLRHKTNQVKKQIDVEVLKEIYANISQNLELTKYQRSQEEPIIEIIDQPMLPLSSERLGLIKGTIIGGFVFFLLIFVFLILKRLVLMVKL